jgi:hypothetical protein
MLLAPVELEAVATAGKEKALLALVSPSRLARLGARMGGGSQSQSDPEEEDDTAPDISGSDTGSDPEYVPPTRQLSSSPDSDSSDEVCTHTTCLPFLICSFQFTQAAPVPTLMQADQFRSLLLSSQRPCQVVLEKAVLPPDQLAALNQVLGCFSSIVCSGDL